MGRFGNLLCFTKRLLYTNIRISDQKSVVG